MSQKYINNYQILELIGQGGSSRVYKAIHAQHRNYVVLKEIDLLTDNSGNNEDAFNREMQIAQNVARHPNIVNVLNAFYENKKYYIVMDYAGGGSLSDIIKSNQFDIQKFQMFARQLASAVQHLHRNDLVHGDIKPENILFDEQGNCKLADFGTGRWRSEKIADEVMFTARYAAPELFDKNFEKVAQPNQADLYALGITLYESLIGRREYNRLFPEMDFSSTDRALYFWKTWHCDFAKSLPKLDAINGRINRSLSQIIDQLIVKDPLRRSSSINNFLSYISTGESVTKGSERIMNEKTVAYQRKNQEVHNLGKSDTSHSRYSLKTRIESTLSRYELEWYTVVALLVLLLAVLIVPYLLNNESGYTLLVKNVHSGATLLVKNQEVGIPGIEEPGSNLQVHRVFDLKPGSKKIIIRCSNGVEEELSFNDVEIDPGSLVAVDALQNCLNQDDMVLIKSGPFMMGNPGKEVDIPYDYWIDKYEVSNSEYRRQMGEEQQYSNEDLQSIGTTKITDDYPVFGLSWYNAKKYCESLGKTLPTEQEWEKAAQANDALSGDRTTLRPAKDGSQDISRLGAVNMMTNVAEWTMDRDDKKSDEYNGAYYIVKGGSFHIFRLRIEVYTYSRRSPAGDAKRSENEFAEIGFRCVRKQL
jgi:serine/threonine protein kinase/formylglycine-generating enzyme required for sulfatase activity